MQSVQTVPAMQSSPSGGLFLNNSQILYNKILNFSFLIQTAKITMWEDQKNQLQ